MGFPLCISLPDRRHAGTRTAPTASTGGRRRTLLVSPSAGSAGHGPLSVLARLFLITLLVLGGGAAHSAPLADLSLQKSHVGTFSVDNQGSYSMVVANLGPDPDPGPIVVTDTLPNGLTYVTSAGSGWSVDSSAAPLIRWQHPGPLPPGQSLPPLALTVAVDAAAVPAVTNRAAVSSPTGDPDARNDTANDPTTVLGPAAGNKPLYVYGSDLLWLSRTPPVGPPEHIPLKGGGGWAEWYLTPALAKELVLTPGSVPVRLLINRSNPGAERTLEVALFARGTTSTAIGAPATRTFTISPHHSGMDLIVFDVHLPSELVLSAGTQIVMRVTNYTLKVSDRTIIEPLTATDLSRIDLNAANLIAIDALDAYDTAYPAGAPPAFFETGDTAHIRATVSDPFGSYDIDRAIVDIVDPNGLPVVSGAAMTVVFDSGAATRVFEYPFAIPADGNGTWQVRVRAHEGVEGLVDDVAVTSFIVGPRPDILLLKTALTLRDPYNGTGNPKAIPGADVLYTVQAANLGAGAADSDTVTLIDPIPPNAALYVGDLGGNGSGPLAFVDGPTASGLTFTYHDLASAADDLAFSSDGGNAYDYVPQPDADGFDDAVTHVRVTPRGVFFQTTSAGSPTFTLRYQVRIR